MAAGFIFWGLFAALAAIVAGYAAWMYAVERAPGDDGADGFGVRGAADPDPRA